jgi:uncharacterized protein (UPF0332 family)
MEWTDVGRDSLSAARIALKDRPRSAVSRAYYACHSVLAAALEGGGYATPANRQTPPHNAQARLIGLHLAHRGPGFVRDLRAVVRRLYAARLDADYNRRVTVDARVSLQAVRDAHRAFQLLEVAP